jgi:translation initiation factor 2-alpha kinase 3
MLAKFDHPNIVRYYAGWLEYTQPSLPAPTRSPKLLEAPNPETDKETSMTDSKDYTDSSLSERERVQDYSSDVQVLFERSAREESVEPSSRRRGSEATTASSGSKRTTVHSVGDDRFEPLETVLEAHPDSQSVFPASSSSSHGAFESSITTATAEPEPQLTLHIQMSLHPLSLADFLSARSENTPGAPEFRHCFHPHISVRILIAVLDGVQYLHDCGVVHRDLKPSNIFLSLNRSHSSSCVDLSRCTNCKDNSTAQSGFLNLRLGDFGLVADIARPDSQQMSAATSSKAVGTELYRPMDATTNPDEKLDVFALGIIAMELLFPFNTRMERQTTLQELRLGKISESDFNNLGPTGKELANCIRSMTCEEKSRLTCSQVRERLERLIA